MMKRMLAMALALVLCLALGMACAEDYAVDFITEDAVYQFGHLLIGLKSGDVVQYMAEEADQQVLALVYPAYNEADSFHCNLNVLWVSSAVTMAEELGGMTPEEWAAALLDATAEQMQAMGVAVSNQQVLHSAVGEAGDIQQATVIYSYDADYTGAGLDLKTTLFQEQIYVVPGNVDGTYALTLSGTSLEDLAALEGYFEMLNFAE